MKDRFKFRAWYYDKDDENDSDNNKMFYNAQDTYDCLGGNPPLRASSFGDIIDDERWVVEQCTGLKDKNGKLIYEGDIVRVIEQCMTNTLDRNYPMLFNEKTAKFGFKHPDGHFFYFTNNDDFSYEVIGNIHENADLLEN